MKSKNGEGEGEDDYHLTEEEMIAATGWQIEI